MYRYLDHTSAILALALILFVFGTLVYYNSIQKKQQPVVSDSKSKRRRDTTQRKTSKSDLHTDPVQPQSLQPPLINNMLQVASSFIPRTTPTIPMPTSTMSEQQSDAVPLLAKQESPWPVKQPFDAFLVLDVEATCQEGTDFNWPNEIIEWPVLLLEWQDKDEEGRAKELVVKEEFRSFVKPTWRPELSAFCTSLTGITQEDIEQAPKFANVLESFREFLVKCGLIDAVTGERLKRFAWCSDGPYDIRDFVVKQCFISKIQMPVWLKHDVLDVRKLLTHNLTLQDSEWAKKRVQNVGIYKHGLAPKRRSLGIPLQLRVLDLPAFVGRQHSGIDDTRNIARIVIELARRGIRLEPNTTIHPGRRWQWMGKPGQVLEEYCLI